jgi:hypothetical protein
MYKTVVSTIFAGRGGAATGVFVNDIDRGRMTVAASEFFQWHLISRGDASGKIG